MGTSKEPARKRATGSSFQIKVTLKQIRPPIWRRFQIAGDTSLQRLHLALQTIMGWSNSHLYQFQVDGVACGEHGGDELWEVEMKDAKKVKLAQVVGQPNAKLLYEYDFGDGWEHELLIENILPAAEKLRYPVCLAGKRRCPPEDCGGPWGYSEFLDAIKNPGHPQHEEFLEWIGGAFDPEEFDIEAVNQLLRSGRDFGACTQSRECISKPATTTGSN